MQTNHVQNRYLWQNQRCIFSVCGRFLLPAPTRLLPAAAIEFQTLLLILLWIFASFA